MGVRDNPDLDLYGFWQTVSFVFKLNQILTGFCLDTI